jgi:hypothetical protein
MTQRSTSDSGPVRADGLLAFWADIDPGYVLRFQQWHNCEHMPERLSIAGFLTGRRYRAAAEARMFFMFYETASPEVLRSPDYLAALNHPTPWTRESLQHFRRPLRSGYRKLLEYGRAPAIESPHVIVYRFSLRDASGSQGAEQSVREWVRAMSQVPGIVRARLYELDTGASGVATEERKIYQGAKSEQRYLALLDSATLVPWETEEWRAMEQALPQYSRPSLFAADLERDAYWLEIALYSS